MSDHPSAGYNHTNNPRGGGKKGGNKGIKAARDQERRDRTDAEELARVRAELDQAHGQLKALRAVARLNKATIKHYMEANERLSAQLDDCIEGRGYR